jgi:hypothetical protein
MAATGCGGAAPHVQAAGASSIQTADCHIWRVLDSSGRRALLAELRTFFGGPVDSAGAPGQRGSVLTDPRATMLLDGYCRAPFADAFKLYKIYGRAAAFSGH